MYQIVNVIDQYSGVISDTAIYRGGTNSFIPKDPANSDYQTFKRDLTEGVELQDAEGNVMTAKAVKDFLKTLP